MQSIRNTLQYGYQEFYVKESFPLMNLGTSVALCLLYASSISSYLYYSLIQTSPFTSNCLFASLKCYAGLTEALYFTERIFKQQIHCVTYIIIHPLVRMKAGHIFILLKPFPVPSSLLGSPEGCWPFCTFPQFEVLVDSRFLVLEEEISSRDLSIVCKKVQVLIPLP